MEGYQVSNQCMALVRDGCLVPTKDAPELGYVIESTDKQYVPDVFYKVSLNITTALSPSRFFESLFDLYALRTSASEIFYSLNIYLNMYISVLTFIGSYNFNISRA